MKEIKFDDEAFALFSSNKAKAYKDTNYKFDNSEVMSRMVLFYINM